MSNLSFRLILIALLLTFGFSYAIEGNWKVTHVGQEEVDSEHGLSMKINDFVFRNTSIMWTLSIEGCRNFKYILEVEEGNLYVDLESFFLSKYSTRQCEQSYIDKEKDLN